MSARSDHAKLTPTHSPKVSTQTDHEQGCVFTRSQTLAFGILIVFALWLRLRLMGYSEIWHDQARTINMALQWLHGGAFPLVGDLTSLGVHNAPLVEYLYAFPLLFKEDMIGICWFIALINLLGILVAGLATARVFGQRVAWWASLLFVVNPFAVMYGRLIWMVSFVPGFASALYACVILYFADEARSRYLILGALSLSATIQTHPTTVTLLPVLALLAIRYFRRIRIRPFWVALGIFILSFTPFLIFHIATGFSDIEVMRSGLQNRMNVNLTAVEIMQDLFRVQTTFDPPVLAETNHIWPMPFLRALHLDQVAIGILGLGILYTIWYSLRPQKQGQPPVTGALVLWLWFCLPLLFFIPHTRLIHHYYFLYLLPIGPVISAFVTEQLYTHLRQLVIRLYPKAHTVTWIAFLPLMLVIIYYTSADLINQNLYTQNQHGSQRIVDVQRAVDNARQLMEERPDCQFVVLADRPLWKDTRFGMFNEFVGRDRVRIVEMGSAYLYPYPCAVYFFPKLREDVQTWLENIAQPLPDYTVQTPTETWLFYDLPAASQEQAVSGLKLADALAVWENGLELTGITAPGLSPYPETSPLVFTYTWEINGPLSPAAKPQPEALRFGNHLLLNDDTLIGQIDGVGIDSREWHSGDIFQTIWHLPLPTPLQPGNYALGLTIYALPDIQRMSLVDGSNYVFVRRFSVTAPEPPGE
ncbi:MAG: hypothetical protein JXA33_04720 [Anaerolineae bacterium]|nr:hypothetical protein [Anaerolineae bacterium]